MIEQSYCAVLTSHDQTVFEPLVPNYQERLASPTGFELKTIYFDYGTEESEVIDISKLKKAGQ